MGFQQPELPYALGALDPFLSELQMSYHYGKHHAAYFKNLNALVEGKPEAELPLRELVTRAEGGVLNNAAQAWNHSFFWDCMSPSGGGGQPSGDLATAIDNIDHQILAPHRHYGPRFEFQGFVSTLDGHCGNDFRQRNPMATFGARDQGLKLRGGLQIAAVEQSCERADQIALVREDPVLYPSLWIVREHAELERGGSNVESESLIRHGFGCVVLQGKGKNGLSAGRSPTRG